MICPNCGNPNLVSNKDNHDYTCPKCKARVPNVTSDEKYVNSKEKINDNNFDFQNVINSVVLLKADKSVGTGFVVSKEGLVLTNSHVLNELDYCYGLIGDDLTVFELELVYEGSKEGFDLCLLKIVETEQTFIPLKIGSKEPNIGDNLFTIGNPKGLGLSLTKGSLSRIHKNGNIQLDMTINPGNSGGPVLNEEGSVVGIVTYTLEEVQGLGFALPISKIKEFLKLIEDGGFNV